jgi:hypothetical protein
MSSWRGALLYVTCEALHSDNYEELCYLLACHTAYLFIQRLFNDADSLCGLVVRVPDYRSRGPGFDSRRYKIFWEVVGLERGPLSLVITTEELLGRNSSGSCLENREYGHGDPLRWPRDTSIRKSWH